MKPTSILIAIPFMASALAASANTITFDDLPTGNSSSDWVVIHNGYAGLNWTGFGAINGNSVTPVSGYNHGVVSGNNVAFDDDQSMNRVAIVSSASPFTLNSAYLTATFVNGMQLQVEGFVGSRLAYDNTYTLNTSGPSFIDFDYQGITSVEFVPQNPDTIFAMDNMTFTPVPDSNRFAEVIAGLGLIAFAVWRKRFTLAFQGVRAETR